MKVALTIAGFDPSGGAGVTADLKTFAAFGCYGIAAVTALTVQNTTGVKRVEPVTTDLLLAQAVAVVEDFDVAALKIGMLPTREVVEAVATLIERYSLKNIVLDPVLNSTSGFGLIDSGGLDHLRERLLPLATLITPNLAETAVLSGIMPDSIETMKEAARVLAQQGPQAVLIKGGHLEGDPADVLYLPPDFMTYTAPRIATRQTHGTGCTLSSAIAALLALDYWLAEATGIAKKYVTMAISEAPGLGHGDGPLNHFPHLTPFRALS